MVGTVLWVIGVLVLGVPTYGIFKNIDYKVRNGALARKKWTSLLNPLFCLLLVGVMLISALFHQFIAGITAFAVFYLRDGFIYWGLETPDKPNKGEEKVRRGTRVVDHSNQDLKKSQKPHSTDERCIRIGGVEIPATLEAQHLLIAGTTGAGKTQVINGLLRTIRKRGQRAIIADAAGGFYARFARPDDPLFNPFDQRTVAWSPFAEIRADYDCERIARAIIPDLEGGESAQWQLFAQVLLAKVLLSMHRNQERSLKRLLYWMGAADQEALEPLLAGTPAAVLCQQGNEKMLNNMRATMMPYLSVFDYMAEEGDFSIRRWVQEEWKQDWLFLTYRDDQMGMLRNLVAACLEMAIVEGLSLSENQNRGLWYVFDELDSLGRISSLRAALTKLRKYGGRCILGIQTISQLRSTYGRNEAQTLLACTSVKCILRTGDSETARSMEQELGEQEIERTQVSETSGDSFNENVSTQIVRQSAVLSSELTALPDLYGYLKIPGDEIVKIKVEYQSMDEMNPAFLGRL